MLQSSSSPPQKLHFVLVIPSLHKRTFVKYKKYKVSHLSPVISESLRGFLYERHQPTSCPDSSWAFWYPTHTVLHGPLDVIGSFDFSLGLYLLQISAQSIEHCPISILEAKQGQFPHCWTIASGTSVRTWPSCRTKSPSPFPSKSIAPNLSVARRCTVTQITKPQMKKKIEYVSPTSLTYYRFCYESIATFSLIFSGILLLFDI